MKCICGESLFIDYPKFVNGIPVGICKKCGIIRQVKLPFDNEEECAEYYRNGYKISALHTFEHDKKVARQRLSRYDLPKNCLLLDVGSGNGAFVEVCRQNNITAFGCELGVTESEHTYFEEIQNINFPTDYFDVITCHDVLEHLINPEAFLKEIFRVLKQDGLFIVDFPNFFVDEGQHHWKLIEHIWYLTIPQLQKFVEEVGFKLKEIDTPIPSKKVLYLSKPKQERVKILVPPGIGDVYWVMVKLQSFLEKNNLGIADILIVTRGDKKKKERAFDYISKLPFVHSTGKFKDREPLWREAYIQNGRTIFPNVQGIDYFIAYNGVMRHGKSLQNVDKTFDCDWYPKMFYSLQQRKQEKTYKEKYGKYILAYFVSAGMYKNWLNEFPVKNIRNGLQTFIKETGCNVILVGAEWDMEDKVKNILHSGGIIDLTGQTTFDELISLIKGSQGVVGFPSGLTILSTVLKKQTYILWNKYFDKKFWKNACPPDSFGNWYHISNTKKLEVGTFITKLKRFFKKRITIACVLKSGGVYDVSYVKNLGNALKRHVTVPFDFVCLTDMYIPANICKSIKLKCNYPGWWSKIELFTPDIIHTDRIVFFDLDTLIVGNIDHILLKKDEFIGLLPFNRTERMKGGFASGVMSWKNNGLFSFIASEFNNKKHIEEFRGDQDYFNYILRCHKQKEIALLTCQEGIYSYKKQCKLEVPKDTKVICFHGEPRIHNLKIPLVKENWK